MYCCILFANIFRKFFFICSQGIVMYPFLKCFGFSTRKILVLYKELGSVSLKRLVKITIEVILAWSFLCGKTLIMNPISLILCRTSQCFYYFWSLFANLYPLGNFPFHQSCWNYCHKVVHCILLVSLDL